jgi:hypothetical protein
MPIFLYRNPNTNEIREIVQSVHEEHIFIDKDGLKWEREFTIPNASIDTQIDANNPNDFVNKTANKRGTLGEILDKSKELSEKREKQLGKDPIKTAMYKKYKDERGKSHPQERREKVKEMTKNVMINIEKNLKK